MNHGTWAREQIDPYKALEYLENTAPNRKIKTARVGTLLNCMLAGHWDLTHHGIGL